jgi:GntR family transcriptional regulator
MISIICYCVFSMDEYKIPLDLSVTIHNRVQQFVEEAIRSGVFKPGDKLPSEREFTKIFSASRTPIRHALASLQMSGLIYSAQGRGYYVRPQKVTGIMRSLLAFGDELEQLGHTINCRTLSIEVLPCDEDVAIHLDLDFGERIMVLQRLLLVDGEPMALFNHKIRNVISINDLREAGDFKSLFSLLGDKGYRAWDGFETISATLIQGKEAVQLKVESPSAGFVIERVYRLESGLPFLFSTFLVRADRYEYQVQIRPGVEENQLTSSTQSRRTIPDIKK